MFNLNRMIQLTVALKSKLKRIKVNSNNQNIVSRCFLIWGCRNAKTLRNCSLSCETAYLPKLFHAEILALYNIKKMTLP